MLQAIYRDKEISYYTCARSRRKIRYRRAAAMQHIWVISWHSAPGINANQIQIIKPTVFARGEESVALSYRVNLFLMVARM